MSLTSCNHSFPVSLHDNATVSEGSDDSSTFRNSFTHNPKDKEDTSEELVVQEYPSPMSSPFIHEPSLSRKKAKIILPSDVGMAPAVISKLPEVICTSLPFSCTHKPDTFQGAGYIDDDESSLFECDSRSETAVSSASSEHLPLIRRFSNRRLRRIVCHVCGKRFLRRDAFKHHQRKHHNLLPFACEHENCKEYFGTLSMLFKHRVIHDPEAKFKCSHCKRIFVSNHALKIHSRIHIRRRSVPCEHCGIIFKLPAHLSKHLRKHHPDKIKHLTRLHQPVFSNSHANDSDCAQKEKQNTNERENNVACDTNNASSGLKSHLCQYRTILPRPTLLVTSISNPDNTALTIHPTINMACTTSCVTYSSNYFNTSRSTSKSLTSKDYPIPEPSSNTTEMPENVEMNDSFFDNPHIYAATSHCDYKSEHLFQPRTVTIENAFTSQLVDGICISPVVPIYPSIPISFSSYDILDYENALTSAQQLLDSSQCLTPIGINQYATDASFSTIYGDFSSSTLTEQLDSYTGLLGGEGILSSWQIPLERDSGDAVTPADPTSFPMTEHLPCTHHSTTAEDPNRPLAGTPVSISRACVLAKADSNKTPPSAVLECSQRVDFDLSTPIEVVDLNLCLSHRLLTESPDPSYTSLLLPIGCDAANVQSSPTQALSQSEPRIAASTSYAVFHSASTMPLYTVHSDSHRVFINAQDCVLLSAELFRDV